MASTAGPYGAIPDGTLGSSGSFSGKTMEYKIASAYDTNIFTGDFVKLVTAGVVEKDAGTTTMTPVGIAVGFSYTDPNTGQWLNTSYWPANTVASDAKCRVVIDPNALFRMQADEAVAQTALNANVAVVQTSGTTALGRSKNAVDGSSIAATTSLPLRIVGFVESVSSTAGDAYTDVIVKFNAGHQLSGVAGLG